MNISPTRHSEQGAVLITGLIFLMILTMLGLSSSQVSGLEQRMAGNHRDQSLAFHMAEAALRAGEAHIEQIYKNGSIANFCDGSAGLFHVADIGGCSGCSAPNCPAPEAKLLMTWQNDDLSIRHQTNSALPSAQPRYYITYIGNIPAVSGPSDPASYRFMVTARGTGGQDNTQVILRSYYGGTPSANFN